MELVRRGLAPSREVARSAIAGGEVTVSGAPALKPSRLVAPHEPLVLRKDLRRFVSRGGDKLDAALARFEVPVTGRVALDAGASTGGFTDCLLQRGAARVVAVDVGHGQLHERLRSDPRVHVIDQTNVRYLKPEDLPTGARPELVVADLSFISLRTVAPVLSRLGQPDADLVLLIKPQFEAGRAEASRGKGIITDPEIWKSAICGVADAITENGCLVISIMASPVLGADGNAEFFAYAKSAQPPDAPPDLARMVSDAVQDALQLGQKTASRVLAEGG